MILHSWGKTFVKTSTKTQDDPYDFVFVHVPFLGQGFPREQ